MGDTEREREREREKELWFWIWENWFFKMASVLPSTAMGMLGTAVPGTAMPMSMQQGVKVSEGSFTKVIYGHIRDGNYEMALNILAEQSSMFPESRAALSLMAFCNTQLGNFISAAQQYEKLMRLWPSVEDYRYFYVQSLYKAGNLVEALRCCQTMLPSDRTRSILLQSYITYEQDDTRDAAALLEQCPADDVDRNVALACVAFKDGRYDDARKTFSETLLQSGGFRADLSYNIALCFYKTKQYASALTYLSEVIEKGVREHPELSVGSGYSDGNVDVRSVGNSQTLHETALIEAFNLKAAIEFTMKNVEGTREALTDMPPRSEEELDPVTLHNSAIMNMDDDPTTGFRKLNFLLQNPPAPPETFGNLLLLYCKPSHSFFDLAADVMAENTHLVNRYLSRDMYDFLDACIMQQTSPDEAYRRFDALSNRHVELLRKLTKQINDARNARDNEAIKVAISEYDDALERYMPGLMAMAYIYWDKGQYSQVERIFRQSAEFCSEHEMWKLNVAHTFFMQDEKFKEAIKYYEPIVKKHADDLLNVTAIVLANLCVSYIMTAQNEEAEEVMRRIEEEEQQVYANTGKQCFHLCIINLVIGTLYCAKGNYEFGISRIIKALQPYKDKIETDTWYYAKRCFLSLIEQLSKHTLMIKDGTIKEIFEFLAEAERHGASIQTTFSTGPNDEPLTVAREARMLKVSLMRLRQ